MIDNTASIGGYLPVTSTLSGLDARIKLVIFFILLALTLTSNDTRTVLLNISFISLLARMSSAPMRTWVKCFWRFSPMLIITFLLNLVFSAPGFYIEIAGLALPVGYDSLNSSLVLTAQLAGAIMLAMIISFCTTPSQLTSALQWFAQPLSWLKAPVGEFSLVIFMAMRFVPLFQQELFRIRDSQLCRGLNFQTGSFWVKGKKLLGIFQPAFISTIQKSEILAGAMTARGFVPGAPRSHYARKPLSHRDLIAVLATLGYLIILFYIRQL